MAAKAVLLLLQEASRSPDFLIASSGAWNAAKNPKHRSADAGLYIDALHALLPQGSRTPCVVLGVPWEYGPGTAMTEFNAMLRSVALRRGNAKPSNRPTACFPPLPDELLPLTLAAKVACSSTA